MSSIVKEINSILDSKENIATILINKFGIQALDLVNSNNVVETPGLSYSDGTIKRLGEWEDALNNANVFWADLVVSNEKNPTTTPLFSSIGLSAESLEDYAINTVLPLKIKSSNAIELYETSSGSGTFITYHNNWLAGYKNNKLYWSKASGVNTNGSTMFQNVMSLSFGLTDTTRSTLAITGNIDISNLIVNNSISAKFSSASIASNSTSNSLIPTFKSVWDAIQVQAIESHKEALLTWGGKDFSNSYGCLDAALMDLLRANRFAFAKAAGITIEYSEDAGATWNDYGASNAVKSTITSVGDVAIKFRGPTNSSSAATDKLYLRFTFDTSACNVYTTLNKFAFYISTNGSNNVTVSIYKALQKTPTNFVAVKENVPISGWAGWNIVNVEPFTTYGNNSSSQYGKIRFVFKLGTSSLVSTYGGADVRMIYAYGGNGAITPSNFAKNGHIYSYDYNQNAVFPSSIYSKGFILSGNSSADNLLTSNGSYITKSNLASALSSLITPKALSYITTAGDYRSTTTKPNDYSNKLIFQGLKYSKNTLSLTQASTTYSFLLGLRGWSDSSGGNAVELAFSGSKIFVRDGATTIWGNWLKLLTEEDSPTFPSLSVDDTLSIGGSLDGVDATFSSNITASAFYESSDAALKLNIKNISDYSKAEKILFKEFKYKNGTDIKYGVIAQDLQEIGLNNLVNTEKEYLSVDYISLLCLKVSLLEDKIKELLKKLK